LFDADLAADVSILIGTGGVGAGGTLKLRRATSDERRATSDERRRLRAAFISVTSTDQRSSLPVPV
jgi:hypothetical protein